MNHSISTYLWPGQIMFGRGASSKVGESLLSLKANNVFVITDSGVHKAGIVDPITASIKGMGLPFEIYDQVISNPDVESVDNAHAKFRESEADVIVGIGGGSVLDTAKSVRLMAGSSRDLSIRDYGLILGDKAHPVPTVKEMPPIIAIPTTAGTGSEVTPWAVITNSEQKTKFGVGGAFLIPDIGLLDPELTTSLSPSLTAATGMDALSHCIEAYVSINLNPILDPIILDGIMRIGRSLRNAVLNGSDLTAREDMLLASLIGGIAISSKWLGACHSLAHSLSSIGNLHHGTAIALMLPYQMNYSLQGALKKYAQIGDVLDSSNSLHGTIHEQAAWAVEAVRSLIADIGMPTRLRDVGVTETAIPKLAMNAYNEDSNWKTNPRALDVLVMENLYREAF